MNSMAGTRQDVSFNEVRQTSLRGERTEEIEFDVVVTDYTGRAYNGTPAPQNNKFYILTFQNLLVT